MIIMFNYFFERSKLLYSAEKNNNFTHNKKTNFDFRSKKLSTVEIIK